MAIAPLLLLTLSAWAGDKPVPSAKADVSCSWTCFCARENGDCDEQEAKRDICVDVAKTSAPRKPADCAGCKAAADADCARHVCPPDPKRGPKFTLSYTCDGHDHVAAAPRDAREVAAMPTVVALGSGRDVLVTSSRRKTTKAAVSCRFTCGCSVKTGMCDEREQRRDMCSDKTESTTTGEDCDDCQINAMRECWRRPCPLAAGMKKDLGRFSCPAQ